MEIEKLFQQAETGNFSKKFIDGARALTFGQIANYSKKFGALMQSSGVKPGDRITVASSDDLEVASIFLSALRYQLSILILDPASKSSEINGILNKVKPHSMFVDRELIDRWALEQGNFSKVLWPIVKQKKKLISRLLGGDSKNGDNPQAYPECLTKLEKAQWNPPQASGAEPVLLLGTSGTTGAPKILRVSLTNMTAAARVAKKQLRLNEETRMLDLLPLTHYDGLVSALMTAFCGGFTLIRVGPFSVQLLPGVFDAIYKYRATHLELTPSILSLMLRLGENLEASFNTEDFQFIISVAGALPPKLWSDFEKNSGKQIVNVYGLTETGNYLFAGPDDESHKIGSIGKPVDCKILITNDSLEPLPAGEKGEILMDTVSVVSPDLDQNIPNVIVNDMEWFPTGDLGYVDDAGIYWITGRKKSLIIIGGRNVYPDEINNALLLHPEVTEAATIGFPDEIWGERVVSCVTVNGTVSSQDLLQFASQHLTDYKAPREIHILPELPRGRSGKVLLSTLVEQVRTSAGRSTTISAGDLEKKILSLASESFRVPVADLSVTTTPQTCNRWDSVAHMDFVVNLESNFRLELLPREVTRITSIAAAMKIVSEKLQV